MGNEPLAVWCDPSAQLPDLRVADLWEGDNWNEMELWLLAEEVGLEHRIIEEIIKVPFDRRKLLNYHPAMVIFPWPRLGNL